MPFLKLHFTNGAVNTSVKEPRTASGSTAARCPFPRCPQLVYFMSTEAISHMLQGCPQQQRGNQDWDEL